MTRLTLALYLAAFGLIGPAAFVGAVYATAEAVHHAGWNPFSPSFDASPASATTAPPVGPESAALKASRGMESQS
jgi:hypothetical protein